MRFFFDFFCNIVAFNKKSTTFAMLLHFINIKIKAFIMKKLLTISTLFAFLLATAFSCKKEEHNHIEIEFMSPANDATVANAAAVNIKIKFTADDDLHDIEIVLEEEASKAKIAPFNPMKFHKHEKTHTVDETVNLSSYPAGTEFHLEVEACEDHDCKEKVKKHIHFKI